MSAVAACPHVRLGCHLEEPLQQVPVALLALYTGYVFKRMHLDVIREVLGQYLRYQEPVGKVPAACLPCLHA